MRILFFTPRQCWPPDTGAKLRDFYLVRELARRAEVTYLGFLDPAAPAIDKDFDSQFERVVMVARGTGYSPLTLVRGLLGPVPPNVLIYTSEGMRSHLSRLLRETAFDIIHVSGVHLAQYLPVIEKATSPAAIWVDWHNIESELMERYAQRAGNPLIRGYARQTAQGLKRLEKKVLATCASVSVPSARERDVIMSRYPDCCPVQVIKNGVDTAQLASANSSNASNESRRSLVFIGSMDYHANVDAVIWFVNEIWPLISSAEPDLKFRIVGRRPGREVQALASQPHVEVTGRVEDIRPYYAAALAAVVPLRVGGGTRLKILEAMAAGVPVVSSRLGAEGLHVRGGRDLLFAETAQEYVRAISKLRTNSEYWRTMSRAGRALVATNYDWSAIGATLFSLQKELRTGAD